MNFYISALGSLTVNSIINILDHLSSQWVTVANRLLLPCRIVNSIQVSRLPSDQACLRKVIEWWFQNTPNPNWETIQEVLQKEQGNSHLTTKSMCRNYLIPSIVRRPANHAMLGLHQYF